MFINSTNSNSIDNKISEYDLPINNNHISSNQSKKTDSLSSLSTTSITIILHALHTQNKRHHRKKLVNQNHSRYRSNSSSSISLPRLTNKTKQSLNEPIYFETKNPKSILSERNRLNIKSKHKEKFSPFRYDKEKTNFILHCNQSTQTDNRSSIREQYPYGNLRRVNSNLLDYIFIPASK